MENIITCHFMGGLGNQLFEAAHALAQGWKNDRPVLFLPKSSTPGQGRGTENYVNNVFRNLKFIDQLDGLTTVPESKFEYCGVDPIEGNTVFYGYFQSTKNWFGYDDKIRKIFSPPQDLVDSFYEKYPQLKNEKTLSLHVRRSEYLKLSDTHPTISIEYINHALELIGEYSTVFVFSDDHEWVHEKLNLSNAIYVDEKEDYHELWLMGLCKNHIISNSTFSWWGVFLNKNKNKRIIAPSVWFGSKGPNGKDIYEDYWEKVEVEFENGKLILKK